jgi:deoxyribonuclease V
LPSLKKKKLFEFKTWEQAASLQEELARSVVERTPSDFRPGQVCGLDAAYLDQRGFASAVLWDSQSRRIVAKAETVQEVGVEYVPGFLGFREGPLIVSAARRLAASTDVFMVDGHGRVHPRRFGLACQVGLALNKPTVGVAKSRFYGRVDGGNIISPDGSLLGKLVETRSGRRFFVSVGNRISLDDAVRLVKSCIVDDHPVPLREAHLEAVRLRRAG